MRIERCDRGSRWLIVQVLDDGRRIVHASRGSLEGAREYMSRVWHEEPTREQIDDLVRDDERVRFRQRYKRLPEQSELDALVAARQRDGIAGRRIEELEDDRE